MMKFLQKLGKSLMLPVAVLPICGLLMGIGYYLCPSTMQGGTVEGLAQIIGFLLVKAGGALIDNMQILFVIGVAVGMADEPDGTPALAGLASWLMIQQLLSTGVVSTIMPNVVEGTTEYLAFSKISNPFIGILCGLIGAFSYNRFKNMQLPDFLAFFSGKRFVAMAAAVISIVASVILLFAWPLVFGALVALGNGIAGMGAIGAGLYAFFNRLLIPIGMHHALNSVFWFGVAGIDDIGKFWGTIAGGVQGVTGMYQAGFFPIMMFGLPGAALAMYHTAKTNKKKVAAGILFSAALCSFFTGVTEPLEFAFMFLAPALYVVHALLTGLCVGIIAALPIRAGFQFSAGFVDWVLSFKAPFAENPIWLIPIGLFVFVLYYLIFRVLIVKLDLKTPGREDNDNDAEMNIELSNDDFGAMAAMILEGIGGASNVTSVDNCITRLRLEVKDRLLVDEKKIKASGAAGVIRPSKTSVQVIIGPKVQFVADEFKKLVK